MFAGLPHKYSIAVKTTVTGALWAFNVFTGFPGDNVL